MTTNLSIHRNFIAPALIAVFLAAVIAGCAAQNTSRVESAEADRLITDIVSREDAASLSVTVKGSQQLTYTAVKQDAPLGVLFHFPDTGLDNLKEVYYPPDNETISSIRVSESTENGRASRIFIALKSDVAYELSPDGADLKIVFPKAGAPAATVSPPPSIQESDTDKAASPPPAAKTLAPAAALVSVNAAPSSDGALITVEVDGALQNYKSFTLTETPPRIVFDIPGIRSPFKGEQRMAVKTGPVSQVRHLGYPEKVRLVVETQKPYLDTYTAEVVDNQLLIQVGAAAVGSKGKGLKLASGPPSNPTPAAAKPTAAPTGSPALVNRVEFADEDAGKSAVIIGTTRPVAYDLVKAGEKQVRLKLVNTQVPEQYKRAVITTRFESAVDRVTPTQGKNEALVAVDLREDVPYTAEQMGNLIRLNFAASTVPPKPYESAEPPAWKTGLAQAPAAESTGEPTVVKTAVPSKAATVSAAPKNTASVETGAASGEKVYTGEKIALDFYDTDIKNVFRILQEISGKNFAIDKNVTGKVTLALQKPVPWDQVMDLVLKMNQLGMVREGDIIRIASLASLQQEEKSRQSQLKAEQDARKQEEEGEPLVTAYIPVNYSAAKADILPHVVNILTPNRGKATVDERNNQVIITDIAEKVRQAKAIVATIDRVTPQVIIEARVVEANSSFTREVGFDWGTITVDAFKIGGALKTGPTTFTANNIPASVKTDNTIGFNFSTLFGTNISIIDAKLTASEVEGKANIISSPKIITLNGKKAVIKQGLEVPYLERDSSGNATVRFKNVDLLLDVTPNISRDKRIVMSIFITKNDVVDPTAPEPALSTNEAKTEILVDDGDTIVIGGILKDTKKMSEQGIPGLRKIPALGWLFRADRQENSKNELLIFITPRIIQLEQRKTT